jgi:hypothetical protein
MHSTACLLRQFLPEIEIFYKYLMQSYENYVQAVERGRIALCGSPTLSALATQSSPPTA